MHGGHHFPRPAILMAAVLVVTGLLHGRMTRAARRRQSIRVTDDGLHVPGRRFKMRKIDATWAEIEAIEIGERWAVITTQTGRKRKLDLSDLESADRVRDALAEAERRRIEYS